MLPDNELLRRYSADRSESAFAELVRRHAPLVYAAAARQLNGDTDLARDVAQVVFADLARKAGTLLDRSSLAGWLYTSARFAAAKLVRTERRRQTREQEASLMEPAPLPPAVTADSGALEPLLSAALHELDESDREAVLLRCCEGVDFKSLGRCLGISDDAARKRVARALERLRAFFEARGVPSSEGALLAALGGVAALHCPADLQAAIVSAAVASLLPAAAPVGSGLASLAGLKTALALTAAVVALGGLAVWQRGAMERLRRENASLSDQLAVAAADAQERAAAAKRAQAEELARLQQEHAELLRLRGEVTRLRGAQRAAAAAPPPEAPAYDPDAAVATQQITIEARFVQAPGTLLKKPSADSLGLDVTGTGVTAILTDDQRRTFIKALEQGTGVAVLAAPRVTTLHNRATTVSSGQADATDAAVVLGPSLELLPLISPDLSTVTLQSEARLTERLPPATGGPEPGPLRQTTISGKAVLRDGETLVPCQRIGAGAAGSSSAAAGTDTLLVLATPVLIDPAGNRLHPGAPAPAPAGTEQARQR